MFLIIHSTPNLNLRNCVRIVEINGHQLRVSAQLPRGFQTAIYPTHFDQKHARFCTVTPHLTPILHWTAPPVVTMKSPRNGPSNRTCQPAQECCWCWYYCYETSQDFSFLWDWVSKWTLMNWTLQLGVGAFIYILPSRTNPPIAHGQNNSGARHRTRFLYVPDTNICKLRLPSRWLVRCDVILLR